MKHLHMMIFAICAATAATAAAKWEIEKHTDEMTDEKYFVIGTEGDPYNFSQYASTTPKLIIRITPGGVNKAGQPLAKQDVIIDFEPDAIPRARHHRNRPIRQGKSATVGLYTIHRPAFRIPDKANHIYKAAQSNRRSTFQVRNVTRFDPHAALQNGRPIR